MKKILLIILVLVSIQSYGQIWKLYAIRQNADATKDSFFTKFPFIDSVFNKNGSFTSLSVEVYPPNSVTPSAFANYQQAADKVWKNFSANINNTVVANGTYTPVLTNVTNVSSSTAYSCQWVRIGNVVTVSGKVDIDPSAAVLTELGMSLPVASAMTAQENLGGTAATAAAASVIGTIRADATNDRAAFVFVASVTLANDSYFFTFSYLIK